VAKKIIKTLSTALHSGIFMQNRNANHSSVLSGVSRELFDSQFIILTYITIIKYKQLLPHH